MNQITVLHTVFHKMGCGEVFDLAALILKHKSVGMVVAVVVHHSESGRREHHVDREKAQRAISGSSLRCE